MKKICCTEKLVKLNTITVRKLTKLFIEEIPTKFSYKKDYLTQCNSSYHIDSKSNSYYLKIKT